MKGIVVKTLAFVLNVLGHCCCYSEYLLSSYCVPNDCAKCLRVCFSQPHCKSYKLYWCWKPIHLGLQPISTTY